MTKKNKMTRAQALENVLGWIADGYIPGDDALVEEVENTLTNMHEQVTRPRVKQEGPTKTQRENSALAETLAEAIQEHGERVTSKWVTEHIRGILTPQKATAVVARGIKDGILSKTKEGKVTYYDLA